MGTVPTITREDLQIGYITRYFLQSSSNRMILEVDKLQYDRFSKNSLYKAVSFKWYITGNISTVTTRNSATLFYYSEQMQGLSNLVRSPLQYFVRVDK